MSVANGSPSRQPSPRYKLAPTDDLLEIQWLCHTYVGQLLDGCGKNSCVEQYCWTGRKNAATKPTRRLTPRSARAIALSVVGSTRPREHLCIHFFSDIKPVQLSDPLESIGILSSRQEDGDHQDDGEPVRPRDPSSWIQQLSDTSAVRQICTLDQMSTCSDLMKVWRKEQRKTEELATLRLRLQAALEAPFTPDGNPNSAFHHSRAAADSARDSLSWLLDELPDLLKIPWGRVNDLISKGSSVGLDVIFRDTHEIRHLDALNDQRSLSLLEQVCKVVGYRRRLESIGPLPVKELQPISSNFSGRVVLQLKGSMDLKSACNDAQLLSQTRVKGFSTYRLAIAIWLKKVILNNWSGSATLSKTSAAYGALELIQSLIDESQLSETIIRNILPIPAIVSRLTAPDIARSWISSKPYPARSQALSSLDAKQPYFNRNTVQLLSYWFIFGQKAVVVFFRAINHLKMRDAHSLADEAEALRRRITNRRPIEIARYDELFKFHEEHYLLLNIERDHIIRDAFDQIWQRRKGELFRPLRVRLGEADEREVGTDLGGVQIEFFNLFCRDLFDDAQQIFTSDPHTGLSWFSNCSLQPLHMFELSGLLLSLAIYNGITLPIAMPLAFYRLLLGLSCDSIEDIQDGWPAVSRSLAYIRENEVDGTMDYSFPLEGNGVRMEVSRVELAGNEYDVTGHASSTLVVSNYSHIQHHPGLSQATSSQNGHGISLTWPGWNITSSEANKPVKAVTESNKLEYVGDYVRWLTTSSIWPQWQAFARGFHTILSPHTLSVFQKNPSTFKLLIEGQPDFDLSSLRLHTRYEGYSPKHTYMEEFWTVVLSWPRERQKQLLKFVTAAERIPIGGVESLTFVIKRMDAIDAEWLPTSSTCFGILYLPEYESARVLEEKLSQAIEFGNESFGTG
ncbi:hypothetical protein K431DRAFT_286945 [Polychaeton citri CBS 116435]|uniref:HECT-type E3 ubiquitin transferase n=1 Tax=Polychaeton citri CBS 116435 TaxID=1314669 RepID=A0A9P4Q450_9PEZI|nr:hypothetical protein K431DRAFT_286945 [Polychaeton citri CBS 116435]